jgi:hypothetical protein
MSLPGGFCTITESNLEQIKVGSTVVYQQAAGLTSLDSDVIIHAPLSGKKVAAQAAQGVPGERGCHVRGVHLRLGWGLTASVGGIESRSLRG